MKRFIINGIYFLLPALLLAVAVDVFFSVNLKKSKSFANGEYAIWNDIYASKANAEIAIYGSSRAWQQIDPQMLEDSLQRPSYNFGVNGHNFWTQYLRHKELLKYNPAPKYILLTTDIFMLEKKTELFNLEQFFPYMMYNKDIYDYTSMFKGFSLLDYGVPLLRYAKDKNAISVAWKQSRGPVKETGFYIRHKGYCGWDEPWNSDLDSARAKIKFYLVTLDTPLVKKFENFLIECKTQNIKLIFVYAPEYIEGQSFVKNRNEILSMYENYARINNIPFLNYSNDELSKHREYFRNSQHLNITGSKLFTAKLINDLKKEDPDIQAHSHP